MKRITTMHLDILSNKSKDCTDECLFISYLHEGRIKLDNRTKRHERYAKKYTQLAFMINPHQAVQLPEEVVQSVHSFHDKLKDINLEQDREKTVRLLKFMIIELNKTVQDWNRNHLEKQPVKLNLTITFVYGDHLILLNFGKNLVYIYREGDLASFKGSRLTNEKHFSLKTGREGKTEYLLFEKIVPPIGEVDFESSQIAVLFNLTHRLLKGDMISVISEDSIQINKFRVNVNLFEHAIERPQMLRLMKQSINQETQGYAWILLTFDEVREFRQTVRYTLFRTLKGLFSFSIMLATLVAPSIYRQQLVVDNTPVQAFDTPATTAFVTLLDTSENDTLNLIPGISGSPEIESSIGTENSTSTDIQQVSQNLSRLINSGQHPNLVAYHPVVLDEELVNSINSLSDKSAGLAQKLYENENYSLIISELNNLPEINWIKDKTIYLPVFSSPYEAGRSLESISELYYGSDKHTQYLAQVNNLNSTYIPYKKTILIPPLEYFQNQ